MLKRQRGLTLVELMVAGVIGLLAIAAVSAIYQTTAVQAMRQLETARLYSTLTGILYLMESDIRRAGYFGYRPGMHRLRDNPFQFPENELRLGARAGEAGQSCILLSYDIDGDGEVGVGKCSMGNCPEWSDSDNVEQLGFRLSEGALQMRYAGAGFDCNSGYWQSVSEPGMEITRFRLNIDSRCLNLDKPETACSDDDDRQMLRNVDIELSAQWKNHPEISMEARHRVHIRNDRIQILEDIRI